MDLTNIIQGVELTEIIITGLAANTVVSEGLPFISKLKSNSTLQLIWNILKTVTGNLKNKK